MPLGGGIFAGLINFDQAAIDSVCLTPKGLWEIMSLCAACKIIGDLSLSTPPAFPLFIAAASPRSI
jgi:hypothetical protein